MFGRQALKPEIVWSEVLLHEEDFPDNWVWWELHLADLEDLNARWGVPHCQHGVHKYFLLARNYCYLTTKPPLSVCHLGVTWLKIGLEVPHRTVEHDVANPGRYVEREDVDAQILSVASVVQAHTCDIDSLAI
ncbi:hypothetical protein SCLCIDRAFT_8973 [Scleroderma citrinum Foug A]|uniref:Uncharacterized protein n=1 Tax=Scleroderma citrinum Foug A TaxID=1036808 RepID=A0A0C3E2U6_9AGAM|nr:hypothetical protein SCLCIDRAFT_8973 [Scleroderma citrinum Foug A]